MHYNYRYEYLFMAVLFLAIAKTKCDSAGSFFHTITGCVWQLVQELWELFISDHTPAGSCIQDRLTIGLKASRHSGFTGESGFEQIFLWLRSWIPGFDTVRINSMSKKQFGFEITSSANSTGSNGFVAGSSKKTFIWHSFLSH